MDLLHLLAEGLHVVEVGIDRIEGVDASSTGSHDDGLTGEQQLDALRRALRLEVGAIVLGAKGDTHHALGGSSNGIGIDHTQRALDGSHDLRAAKAANLLLHALNLSLHLTHLIGGLRLRHTNHIDASLDDSLDVLLAIRRGERVDTHHHLGRAVVDGLQRVVNEQTCGIFLSHRHRVLQVEHNRVGTVDEGILHHTGVVARHEHHSSS